MPCPSVSSNCFVQVQNRFSIWTKVLLFEPKLKIILNVCAELVSSIRQINYFSLFPLLVLSPLRGSFIWNGRFSTCESLIIQLRHGFDVYYTTKEKVIILCLCSFSQGQYLSILKNFEFDANFPSCVIISHGQYLIFGHTQK